jgi:hypothetical protein
MTITYKIGPNGLPYWEKDPEAVKDYELDWTAWLDGDTISAHTVTAQDGLSVDANSEASGVVTIWLSGGTHGRAYKVTCEIVTVGGRTEQRSFEIHCKNQ